MVVEEAHALGDILDGGAIAQDLAFQFADPVAQGGLDGRMGLAGQTGQPGKAGLFRRRGGRIGGLGSQTDVYL